MDAACIHLFICLELFFVGFSLQNFFPYKFFCAGFFPGGFWGGIPVNLNQFAPSSVSVLFASSICCKSKVSGGMHNRLEHN